MITERNLMRAEDVRHVNRVVEQHSALTRDKYANGRREHGGNCWEKPGMLAHAIDESADLPVYLWTLRDQLLDIAMSAEGRGEHVTAAQIRFVINK